LRGVSFCSLHSPVFFFFRFPPKQLGSGLQRPSFLRMSISSKERILFFTVSRRRALLFALTMCFDLHVVLSFVFAGPDFFGSVALSCTD